MLLPAGGCTVEPFGLFADESDDGFFTESFPCGVFDVLLSGTVSVVLPLSE